MDSLIALDVGTARNILEKIEERVIENLPREIERVIGTLDVDAQKSLVRLMREHLVPREIDDLANNGCGEITDGGRLVAMELIKRGLVSLD